MVILTMACDACGDRGKSVSVSGNVMRSTVDGLRGSSDYRRMRATAFGPLGDLCPSCAKQMAEDQRAVERRAKAR